ncbi:polysaccharide biosynthesis/export family protein [Sphingomicrobium aestuariivivum]|uniref:polysaccharide biosynthesis/export family protein n=1 Tax=Sphingomicrobium aestuariivivum TaxID=1582356 RepID=UPI001FD6B0C9|nr:polysaccharide biosynthesis/export family protein [Sphingomicrobium aestuariivivum]MCJ8192032.1 polysaccharide export protein [Sphingomicrobium aestuariivivum]
MFVRLVMSLVAISGLAACSSTPGLDRNSQVVAVAETLPAPDANEVTAGLSEYRLGPSDEIEIAVFNAPELERKGQIDAAGNILLPLIGSVAAGGMTPIELADQIADQLRGRYIRDPQVSVNVLKARAHTVTVDGAVEKPGIYPISGPMTLQRAIATAEGLSKVADTDKVIIFRRVDGQKMAAMFDLNEIRSGRVDDPQIFGNDIVVVGESGVRRFLSEANGVPLLSRFIPIL